ncbi:hypothetical protein B0H14DRAFT_2569315 [Mycena olivaceomarginata]|nr:hypothetical protein B0H14DRAFT_2569315 [Mycena olivaceomarginata]
MSMNVQDVVWEYMGAWRAAFKPETITQSWSKSGIDEDPATGGAKCNPDRFTAADFAPSSSTSTQLQMPAGYPARPASPSSESSSSSSDEDDESSSNNEGDEWQDVTSAHPPRHRAALPSLPAVNTSSTTPPLQPLPSFTNIYGDSARNRKLKQQRTLAWQQRDEASSHAILAGDHIKTLKGQLNAKQSKARGSSGRIVQTQSRIVTTAEGRATAAAQKDAREEREAATVLRQTKKDDAAGINSILIDYTYLPLSVLRGMRRNSLVLVNVRIWQGMADHLSGESTRVTSVTTVAIGPSRRGRTISTTKTMPSSIRNVRIWTLRPTTRSRQGFGSDFAFFSPKNVRIVIGPGGQFLGQSVRIRIGHITVYALLVGTGTRIREYSFPQVSPRINPHGAAG